MSNKVVLITGASGALGNPVTNRFLAGGATVVGSSRRITADEFPSPNFVAMPADFTNDSAVRTTLNSIVQKYGRLDAVIHVLGGFAGGKSIAETDDSTWNRMRDQNLNSAFYVLRAAVPHLRKSGNGRIVAIGSLTATAAQAGLGAYVAFKAALSLLVQTVALENKDAGVTANVILPGTMDTPANRKAMPNADFSKWLKTESVAELAFFLAQDSAAHITGAVIPVDGQNG
jgi:NAD(P)-dependent dehydrogenase (short-subunit alcohol dehydrogenase family)